MKRTWGVAVVALLLAACAVSRELQNIEPVGITAGIIGGTVKDSISQQPIVGVELTLLSANGDSTVRDQQAKTFTFAPRGEFRFDDVRPGTYTLRASAVGYRPALRKIDRINAGERITAEFALSRNQ